MALALQAPNAEAQGADLERPGWPVVGSESSVSSSSVTLNWSASTDNVGVSRYQVYLNTSTRQVDWVDASVRSHTFDGVAPGRYWAAVRAEDAAGNLSPWRALWVRVQTPAEQTAEIADAGLIATAIEEFVADGNALAALGGKNGQGWFNYQNGTTYPFTMASTLVNGGYLPARFNQVESNDYMVYHCGSGQNQYAAVFSFVNSDNGPVSDAWSCSRTPAVWAHHHATATMTIAEIAAAANDTTAPLRPGWPVVGSESSVSSSSVTLNWSASTDNVGVSRYQVYLNTSTRQVDWVDASVRSHTFDGVAPGRYWAAVRAEDAAGNLSPWRALWVRVQTPAEQTAEIADAGLIATAIEEFVADGNALAALGGKNGQGWFNYQNGTTYPFTMASTLVNGGYLPARFNQVESNDYMVYPCGSGQNQYAAVFSFVNSDNGPASDAWSCSRTPAVWAHHHATATMTIAEIAAAQVDGEAPTTPGDAAYGSNYSSTSDSINVYWTASTDNVGVTGYEVTINTSPQQTVQVSASTRWHTFNNLAAGTYDMTVRATDAAGNWSQPRVGRTETVSTCSWLVPNNNTSEDITAGSAAIQLYTDPADECPRSGFTIAAGSTFKVIFDDGSGWVYVELNVSPGVWGWAKTTDFGGGQCPDWSWRPLAEGEGSTTWPREQKTADGWSSNLHLSHNLLCTSSANGVPIVIADGDTFSIQGISGDWAMVSNADNTWGWIETALFDDGGDVDPVPAECPAGYPFSDRNGRCEYRMVDRDLDLDSSRTVYDNMQVIHKEDRSERQNGGFRTRCLVSHFSYVDPLLYPNQATNDPSHLHMFFGNTSVSPWSTNDATANPNTNWNHLLNDAHDSTCGDLGEHNKSAYWIPALFNRDEEVVVPDQISVYYKITTDPGGQVRPIPNDLKMVGRRGTLNVRRDEGTGDYFLVARVEFLNCIRVDSSGAPVKFDAVSAGTPVVPVPGNSHHEANYFMEKHYDNGTDTCDTDAEGNRYMRIPGVEFNVQWSVNRDHANKLWRGGYKFSNGVGWADIGSPDAEVATNEVKLNKVHGDYMAAWVGNANSFTDSWDSPTRADQMAELTRLTRDNGHDYVFGDYATGAGSDNRSRAEFDNLNAILDRVDAEPADRRHLSGIGGGKHSDESSLFAGDSADANVAEDLRVLDLTGVPPMLGTMNMSSMGSSMPPTEESSPASLPQRDANGNPYCASADSDSDGDGWGFENDESCVVRS